MPILGAGSCVIPEFFVAAAASNGRCQCRWKELETELERIVMREDWDEAMSDALKKKTLQEGIDAKKTSDEWYPERGMNLSNLDYESVTREYMDDATLMET